MTGGFLSAAIIAPRMPMVAAGCVYGFTGRQDRHGAPERRP